MKLPYIIAEIGLNHEGSITRAFYMIEAAARAGANAVKFQWVRPDRLVSRNAPPYFQQVGAPAQTQHEFFSRVEEFDHVHFETLAEKCHECGVDFLCTPFDVETVEWLNPLVPAFKIASADITNIPLLEAVARTGKPVYLSTGAATTKEIRAAARVIGLRATIMHCVLSYPTPPSDANLEIVQRIAEGWPWLSMDDPMSPVGKEFPYPAGYSDHTLFNLDVLTTAWLLGATVIEKHFTLDKTLPGNDHYHSMDPTDLRTLVAKLKELQAMIGDGEKRVLPCEEAARLNARQSWHAARDLPVGHVIAEGDVVLKRPGTGLAPREPMVGQPLRRAVRADEPITDAHVFYKLDQDLTAVIDAL